MATNLRSYSTSASRLSAGGSTHQQRMTTLATPNGPITGSFSDLFLILQQHGIEHLAAHIADCGFGVSDIGNVFKTEQDVTRLLRVTNRSDRGKLVGLASHIRSVDERFMAQQQDEEAEAEKARQLDAALHGAKEDGDNTEEGGLRTSSATGRRRVRSPIGAASAYSTTSTQAAVSQQTFLYRVPTNATANEYCRQAATFLEHYRVDRAWPKKRSVLSKTLGLPTAEDPLVIKSRTADHIATHKLYTSSSQRTNSPNNNNASRTDGQTDDLTATAYETGGTNEDEPTFKVYQRPARHFSVPTDTAQRMKHYQSVAERDEAIRSGHYGGSWKEVGQRHPDKGGPLDPFPTAKGPSLKKLHAMHAHDDGTACGHGGGDHTSTMKGNLYETHIVHQHGCQARQCPVCRHHAREKMGDGCWQYLAMVRLPPQFDASAVAVDLKAILRKKKRKGGQRKNGGGGSKKKVTIDGDHLVADEEDGGDDDDEDDDFPTHNAKGEELVPMWVPFPASESLLLETAYRKKAITILVCGKIANLNKMRWNKRPLRRSHIGSIPFPIEHGLKAHVIGDGADTDDEVDAMEEALRKAAEAERLAKALRDSFLALLGAEEDKSRATIEAEEDTQRRGLKADMQRKARQIYNNLLENVLREEELGRRQIRSDAAKAFEDTILAPLADQWRQEEVRRLAKQEIEAAKKILAQQRALVEDHERNGRAAIEDEEAEEWSQLERALRHLHGQIELFHRQLHKDRNGGGNGCTGGFEDGTRCAKCLDPNCPFHRKPWANHWRRVGGSLDVKPFSLAIDTLDGLVATALDRQYEELAEAGAAGGWGGASGGAGSLHQRSRARGTAGLRYHSSQRKAKTSDVYDIDANGNVTTTTPSKMRSSSSAAAKRPATASAARGNSSRPQSPPSLGTAVSASESNTARNVPRPPNNNGFGAANSRPQSAGPGGRSRRPTPPPIPQPPAESSGFNYAEQPSVRVRRQEENGRKPAPFKHSKLALDPNDVYRGADESERSPRARGRLGGGGGVTSSGYGQQQRSQSSSNNNGGGAGGYGYEAPRFADSMGQSQMSQSGGQAAPTRRKMARGGGANRDVVDDDDGEYIDGLGNLDDGAGAPAASSSAAAEVRQAQHAKRFGFGISTKQSDKIVGEEFKPVVVSHYERMRRKLQKGGDKKLTHLQAM